MPLPPLAIPDASLEAREIHFAFDATPPFGDKEHFFHFLHGYVIPALSLSLEARCRHVRFEDCGPVMNPKLADACRIAGLDPGPALRPGSPRHPLSRSCLVPRWDEHLLRFEGSPQSPPDIQAFRSRTASLRQYMLARSRVLCEQRATLKTWRRADILVLKRPPDHPYYAPGGQARFPRYGGGRRALRNTSDIAAHLVASGRRALEVDMGRLPLWDQIMAFHHASCVIGARGAEFAHLFWMRPGATAVMFATPVDRENNATRSLSEIFDIRFIAPTVKSSFFSIPPEEVGAFLP